MKKYYALVVFFLLTAVMFADGVKVTFQVNMAVQIKRGTFVPGSDSVVVRGDFQADASDPAGNWAGNTFKLTPATSTDSIYKVVVTFPTAKVGTAYNYKFVKDNATWESNDNRPFTLASADQVLYPYYFNNDSVFVAAKTVTATVTFVADIRAIWGSGDGYFDDSADSLWLAGLGDWDSKATVVSGSRRPELINPTSTGVYVATLVLKGTAGDSTQYKYQAFPASSFANTGWETGSNRYFHFPYSDSTFTLATLVPNIFPTAPLKSTVTVLFTLKFPANAVNAKNNLPIPQNKIIFTAIKGSVAQLGLWGGNWTASDTAIATGDSIATLILMNDKGLDGDVTPGDGIWSKKIVFNSGSQGGLVEYKYTCEYPGADTVNGGSTPLDNEYAFALNHQFLLAAPKTGNTITLPNTWGVMGMTSDVKVSPIEKGATMKFNLDQNYPNPFNPSTKIKFVIPNESQVTLKVYNVIGKEVATLVNQNMKAGSYEATFDASQFSTGVYLYRLTAGTTTMVKKMMLVK